MDTQLSDPASPPLSTSAVWSWLNGSRGARGVRALTGACAVFPLVAVVVLSLLARFRAVEGPPVLRHAPAISADMAVIEKVLMQRAPDLGLKLRHQVAGAIVEEALAAGYDPLLIVALIDVESDFKEGAVSDKGARGLMQIRPSTLFFLARAQGLKLTQKEVASDPALCVRLGIRYLRELNDRFGDLDLALMAYNAGPTRIRQAVRGGGLEVFRGYPSMVRRDFRRFREGQGLGGDWAWAQRGDLE